MAPLSLPGNFPTGSTDEEILRAVATLHERILESRGNINDVMRLTPLAQSGQNELMRRYIQRSADAAAETSKQSVSTNQRALTISKRSLIVSVVAAGVSIMLSAIAAYFAWEASSSSSRWEARQVPILQGIRDELADQRREVRESLGTQTRILQDALKARGMAAGSGSRPASRQK